MDRIATTTKAVDLFGSGKHGFKNGDLGLGVAPTDFNAEWFNGVQEELLAIIEAAGTVPAGGTRNQVLTSLAAALATRPEFAKNLAASGYQKLPGGLLLQWGSYQTASWSSVTGLSFPIAWPNGLLNTRASEVSNTSPKSAGMSNWTTTTFDLYVNGSAGAWLVHWLALGW